MTPNADYEPAARFAWTGEEIRESVAGVLDRRVRGSRGGGARDRWDTEWDQVWQWEDASVT
jgi:hypothetical protein